MIRPKAPTAQAAVTHPVLGGDLGLYSYQLLSDEGQLTQFGAFIEHLPPGSRSSFRHWHEAEDEAAYILHGHPVLVEDTETPLSPGDCLVWPKGAGPGHCLRNPGPETAGYLVIGTRLPHDRIHYPDHDLITEKDGSARRHLHLDGRPR